MAASPEIRAEIAAALASAERERMPMPPLAETWAGLDVDDAYEIQRLNVRRRLDAGERVLGHKVGLTSRAMQEMLGVDQPDYGHLLDTMFVPSANGGDDGGSAVPVDRYVAPRAEIEIAFVLGAPVAGPGVTLQDVLAATDHLRPAIEIIDSRIADWRIGLVDTIADNASSAGVMLGAGRTSPDNLDLAAVGGRVVVNGEVADGGTGADVLDHPAAAVAWLANTLGRRGARLEAGHVALPGACTRAVSVRPGDRVEADFDVLGGAAVTFR